MHHVPAFFVVGQGSGGAPWILADRCRHSGYSCGTILLMNILQHQVLTWLFLPFFRPIAAPMKRLR